MTQDSCIIDGKDISTLGMFILRGGDYDFLSFPERKEPASVNWWERSGIDADLSDVYFKEKKVVVRFYVAASDADEYLYRLDAFNDLISRPGERTLYSREFGRTFRLRYIGSPALIHKGGLYKPAKKRGEIGVEFSMDDPLQIIDDRTILIPTGMRTSASRVSLNGVDLSQFGIIVNECYNTALKLPGAKQPLTRVFDRRTGLIAYAPGIRSFETKQIVVECTMVAPSREEFYHNYQALFNNIALPGGLMLETYNGSEKCYYAAMQGFKKLRPFSVRAMVSFSLVFIVVDTALPDYLLSTEDGNFVITQDEFLIKI